MRLTQNDIERFWSKVDRPKEGCWEWQAGIKPDGYGQFMACPGGVRKSLRAHRVSWELTHGLIPGDLCVLHRCDNRKCVRPDHLFLGTRPENMHDMAAKGRSAKGDRSGYRLHPENYQAYHRNLTEIDPEVADIIRRRYAQGNVLQKQLAAEYGVARSVISRVVHRRRRIDQ
jgi:hypothetical protein